MSDPIDLDSACHTLLPAADAAAAFSAVEAADASRALAMVSRLARAHPLSDELRGLLEGKLGQAVSAAADFAADAIAPATRAAYIRNWEVFATWCREQGADSNALPTHPVLIAAYMPALPESSARVRCAAGWPQSPTTIVAAA